MHNNNQFNWDEPEDTTQDKDLERLRSTYIKCFSTDAGKLVLEDLYRFLDLPVADPNYTHAQACCREGQNQIIRRILQLTGEPNDVRNRNNSNRSNSGSSSKNRYSSNWRKFIRKLTRRS